MPTHRVYGLDPQEMLRDDVRDYRDAVERAMDMIAAHGGYAVLVVRQHPGSDASVVTSSRMPNGLVVLMMAEAAALVSPSE